MRTTFDIEDDLLLAAKEIAQHRGVTTGRAISDLLRQALEPKSVVAGVRNGVPLLSRRTGAPVLTMARVNELRDE